MEDLPLYMAEIIQNAACELQEVTNKPENKRCRFFSIYKENQLTNKNL
jgi:hypothetical protein